MIDPSNEKIVVPTFRKLKSRGYSLKKNLSNLNNFDELPNYNKNILQRQITNQINPVSPFQLIQFKQTPMKEPPSFSYHKQMPANISAGVPIRHFNSLQTNLEIQLFGIFQTEFQNLLKELNYSKRTKQNQIKKDTYEKPILKLKNDEQLKQNPNKQKMHVAEFEVMQQKVVQKSESIDQKNILGNRLVEKTANEQLYDEIKPEQQTAFQKHVQWQSRKMTLNQLSVIQQNRKSSSKFHNSQSSFYLSKSSFQTKEHQMFKVSEYKQQVSSLKSHNLSLSPQTKEFVRSNSTFSRFKNDQQINSYRNQNTNESKSERVIDGHKMHLEKILNEGIKVMVYNKLLFARDLF